MAKDALRFLGDPDSPVNCTCEILNKERSAFNYVQYMFDRTNRMFHYENLPDTIPEPMFEYMIQIYGSVAVLEHEGSLYAFRCNFGGPPDPYYRPTQAVVANPALGLTGTFRVVNHLPPFARVQWESMPPCVRVLNDSQIQGLLPLFSRYAWQMTENDISIRSAQINLRQQSMIVADTGPEIESAQAYIKGLEDGRLSVVCKRPFTDGIKLMGGPSGNTNSVVQLIELQQYLKASWYNEIGLNSNFNMKREYVGSDEINSTADILLPLIDNMFEMRKQAVESINKQFGTNISVDKDSAWERKEIAADLSLQEAFVDLSSVKSTGLNANDELSDEVEYSREDEEKSEEEEVKEDVDEPD